MVALKNIKHIFVARGFSLKEGVDFGENFALVARYTLVRAIIAIVATIGWKIHQIDVKTAFLNEILEEEVYLEQPEGFLSHDVVSYVCKFKNLYMDSNMLPEPGMKGLTNIY